MKTRPIFLFILLFLAGGSAFIVSAQDKGKVLTTDITSVEVDKGWTLLASQRDKQDRPYMVFSYKTDSVVRYAPHSFKFVVKIKEYSGLDVDYSLLFWELRCRGDMARVPRQEMWLKKPGVSGERVIAREDPDLGFQKVDPIFSAVISKQICKKYDKP